MYCSEAEGLFDAYLDGELSGTLRLEFDTHRLHCPVCQQKLSLLETTEYVISTDLRGPSLSDDFTDKLVASLQQRKMAPRPLRLRRPLLAAAVVLQAAAVVAFLAFMPKFWNRVPSHAEPIDRSIELADIHKAVDDNNVDLATSLMLEKVEQVRRARQNIADDVSAVRNFAWSLDLPGFGNGVSLSSLLQSIFGFTPSDTPPDRPADAPDRGSI